MTGAIDVAAQARGVRAGDRRCLARAITLVESVHPEHRAAAHRLVAELLPAAGRARRVGVTGLPGAGKSTLLEALGTALVAAGQRVAVLAVDPSSGRTGGSILGDRTRMPRLAALPGAFVRPAPSGGTLGGVAAATGDVLVLLDAAGFDVVLVETVGTGQSESAVRALVDTLVLVGLAGTGDDLQHIKCGVAELADVFVLNKADGPRAGEVRRAAAELGRARRTGRSGAAGWSPPVVACSALENTGVDTLWEHVLRHQRAEPAGGETRRRAAVDGLWSEVQAQSLRALRTDPAVRVLRRQVEAQVADGRMLPGPAAELLLRAWRDHSRDDRPPAADAVGGPVSGAGGPHRR
ncbi:methylmalonyl Co-A mutase-associated GTPase MeaB [Actinoplanes sp. N902-109]|uniref:methylmalonyl Co-A mutase-associated GTPase MeaB n=1 Tax=Actinoplanes sp. (strain N902-109) TaxID=649831 RepID=UPI000329661B|nr:methylmalonyl Co-A mutase-associated GTPase MeaB [Actinoplanes sp. N902-109]AGL15977.1 arginine/ornithine transport system ATPase [Actinoplanes sp. N902-109]